MPKSEPTEVLRFHVGDMYIEIIVETPVNLSKRQRELLEEFGSGKNAKSTSPESEGFFAKVKELWQDLTE